MSHQSSLRPARCAPISLIVLIGWIVPSLLLLAAPGAQAQGAPAAGSGPSGVLFPEPFVAEHHLVQSTPDGDRFETEPVTDYYGGSWIVSVHPDGQPGGGRPGAPGGDRDPAGRRHLLDGDVRPARGPVRSAGPRREPAAGGARGRRSARDGRGTSGDHTGGGAGGARGSRTSETTRWPRRRSAPRRRMALRTATGFVTCAWSSAPRPSGRERGMEIWLDPSITLRPAAVEALDALGAVLGKGRGPDADAGAPSVDRYLAAARSSVPGGFPVRTVRTVGRGPAALQARLEDVTTRSSGSMTSPRSWSRCRTACGGSPIRSRASCGSWKTRPSATGPWPARRGGSEAMESRVVRSGAAAAGEAQRTPWCGSGRNRPEPLRERGRPRPARRPRRPRRSGSRPGGRLHRARRPGGPRRPLLPGADPVRRRDRHVRGCPRRSGERGRGPCPEQRRRRPRRRRRDRRRRDRRPERADRAPRQAVDRDRL